MKLPTISYDLLQKYDKPGPRYTSYPTAPYFTQQSPHQAYLSQIEYANSIQKPISLYVHIPFCDTLCWFCGCNTSINRNPDSVNTYLQYLEKEMQLYARMINPQRQVLQIHWGGGTPTHLTPEQIVQLNHMLQKYFCISPQAEVSVEIDPRELTLEHVQALAQGGFNRASLGIQDFDHRVQKAVNRIQSFEITQMAVQWLTQNHFSGLNLDLMYGLPYQNLQSFTNTIQKALSLQPQRLAVFSFAYLPQRIPHQKLIQEHTLPTAQQKLDLLNASIQSIREYGMEYIGMDHFAKPDDSLYKALMAGSLYRNFQGYSTHAGLDLYALGSSSISMSSAMYVQNYRDLPSYYSDLDNNTLPIMRGVCLSKEDELRRELITQIMCRQQIEFKALDEYCAKSLQWELNTKEYLAKELLSLQVMEQDALVEITETHLNILPQGRFFLRNVAMHFDAYLNAPQSHGSATFSRTV
jgi:oxygen-independent coproporphyrinogen III oxidase